MSFSSFFVSLLSFFRLLYVSAWTLKRDLRGARMFIEASLRQMYARKRNLTGHKIFDGVAAKHPNKVCFYFDDEKWTFKQVQDMSNQVANYFASMGYIKGDSVALLMENKPEYIVIWLGLARLGVKSALINTNLRNKSLQHCIEAASCRAIIYGQELSGAVKEICDDSKIRNLPLFCLSNPEITTNLDKIENAADMRKDILSASTKEPKIKDTINFNDGMLYIYTSGTTGLPKAAIIKHSRFQMMITLNKLMHGVTKNDTVYTPLPLYHAAGGAMAIGQALNVGASVAFRKKFSASQFWNDCIKYEVTIVQYIGEICRFLLAQPPKPEDKLHQVRVAFGNGLRPEIWTSFTSRFNIPNISELYGSTEGNCNFCNFDNTVGAVGFVPPLLRNIMPFFLVKVDKEGEIVRDETTGLAIRCGVNEPGEMVGVVKKGTALGEFDGYTDEKANQKKIVTNVRKHGDSVFRSGDILRMDEFGYCFFMDRQGDTFRWKGENVSTAEVEMVLSRALGLKDAAVYGVVVPGADGRAGMASIVDPNNEVDLDKLAKDLKKELPLYARPMFIRCIKEMPMTGTFKLKKVNLQTDGYDITRIQDKVYMFSSKEQTYLPLTYEIYSQIISAQLKM